MPPSRRKNPFIPRGASPKSARRAWALRVAGGFGLLLVLAAGLSVYRLNQVRSELNAARDSLQSVVDQPQVLTSAQGRADATSKVDRAVRSLSSARHHAADSLVLSALRAVPGLRGQRAGLITLIDDVSASATAGRRLLGQVVALADGSQVREGQVPFAGIEELGRTIDATANRFRRLVRPPSGLWLNLADARRRFDDIARSSADRLSRGADNLRALSAFLGASGDRTYFLALQNNSEMRDQGMVLSYVGARFERGRLSFEPGGSVERIMLEGPAPTPIPTGTAEVFGSLQPTRTWQSVNATADFAWSARAMVDMYRQATGRATDGVIAIDIPGLAGILNVVGPVPVPGIAEPITAENVARITLHDLYEGVSQSTEPARRERQAEISQALGQRLTTGTHDSVALGLALAAASKGGHLRLWSGVTAEEEVFERSGLGGGPGAVDADHTFHVAVENRAATKLDYFVRPSVNQDVRLDEDGTAVVRTTVRVSNGAPVGAAPSYQLGPDQFTKQPGDYLAWVLLWGPPGATQDGSTPESGLRLSQRVSYVAAGGVQEVSFETVIPNAVVGGRLRLRLVPQARLEPVDLQVRLTAPGWDVKGPTSWRGPWEHVQTFDWRVGR